MGLSLGLDLVLGYGVVLADNVTIAHETLLPKHDGLTWQFILKASMRHWCYCRTAAALKMVTHTRLPSVGFRS